MTRAVLIPWLRACLQVPGRLPASARSQLAAQVFKVGPGQTGGLQALAGCSWVL